MDNAIEYAKSQDVLLVSAVGNDGTQVVSYPAIHNDVVAVTQLMQMQGSHLFLILAQKLIFRHQEWAFLQPGKIMNSFN